MSAQSEIPLVYIMLVNFNGRDLLLRCLASLRSNRYENSRILVVDNGSSDGSLEAVASEYPDAELLALGTNRGFTGANNEGFSYALDHGAEYVYLLNPDTWIDPGFLVNVITTAQSDPMIGIIGSKVLHGVRPELVQFAGGRVGPLAFGKIIGRNKLDDGQFDDISDVDWVMGCGMTVSRACWKAVGGFDNRLFMYQEDVDISFRALAKGFRVVMAPSSRIWHLAGGLSGGPGSPSSYYYATRNGLYIADKHRPMPLAFECMRSACIVSVIILKQSKHPSGAVVKAILEGAADYLRGISGMRPGRKARESILQGNEKPRIHAKCLGSSKSMKGATDFGRQVLTGDWRSIAVRLVRAIKADASFSVDPQMHLGQFMPMLFARGVSMLRGYVWAKPRLGASSGPVFWGRGAILRGGRNVHVGRGFNVGHYSIIDGTALDPVCLGNGVTLGCYVVLRATGSLRHIGAGVSIGDRSSIGDYSSIGGGVHIGNDVLGGQRISFLAENHRFDDPDLPISQQGVTRKGIIIGNNCWIGNSAIIVDGVVVGDGAVIGAGSVVTHSVPAGAVVAGVPARVIRMRVSSNQTE